MKYNLWFITVLFLIPVITAEPDVGLLRNIANSNEEFAFFLQLYLSYSHHPGNLVFSPMSVQLALAMTSVGTGDNSTSYNEIKTRLQFPDDRSKMIANYQSLIDDLTSSKGVLALANRLYIDKKFTVKPEFSEITRKYFKSDTEQVDFQNNPDGAVEKINSWVEQQSNNTITDLIGKDDLTPFVEMILINAMHFKSEWEQEFDPTFTRKEKFYAGGTEIEVDMMNMEGNFKFYHDEDNKFKFLELPYKADGFSMILALPDSRTGIDKFKAAFARITMPQQVAKELQETVVKVSLPKFNISKTYDLILALESLEVREIFSRQADFTNISPTKLLVSNILQKAFVSVDEYGTEADAATKTIFQDNSALHERALESEEFRADHPFYFFITKELQGTPKSAVVLFSGIYMGN